MLLLKFQAAGQTFAVDSLRVVEVIPWVQLRPLPHAPAHLAGLLAYRGQVAPVLDLGLLLGGAACVPRLSTRIIVARPTAGTLLGLLAERIRDVVRARAVVSPGVPLAGAPYLGPVIELSEGLVQLIEVEKLAPELWSPVQEGAGQR